MQICVPPELSEVLKAYTKEVIRRQPEDLVEFSAYYFANLADIIPETCEVVPPTVPQVSALFRALSSANMVRACDVRRPLASAQPVTCGAMDELCLLHAPPAPALIFFFAGRVN